MNSLDNLSWASTSINQEVNNLYATYDKSKLGFLTPEMKDKLYKEIDGVPGAISIREHLSRTPNFGEHKKFKDAITNRKAYREARNEIKDSRPILYIELGKIIYMRFQNHIMRKKQKKDFGFKENT